MNIRKQRLEEMKRCYSVGCLQREEGNLYFFASEDPDVACDQFSGAALEQRERVWTKPGGCMSILQIPGKEEFLAIQEFYLKVSPSQSKLIWARRGQGVWVFEDLWKMPYLHRFGIVQGVDGWYVVAATIADDKANKEDWSRPGSVYVGRLPERPQDGLVMRKVLKGLFRNHGFWQTKEQGEDVIYLGSDQGVYTLRAPSEADGDWRIEHLLTGAIGEVATIDIDGDGEVEMMTIEPFHGNQIRIYKKQGGTYQVVYEYEPTIDFAHALVGTTLAGRPCFLAGVRREEAELFCVYYEDGAFQTKVLDRGVGPANLAVVHEGARDLILAANHTANEAAVYFVEEGACSNS